MECVDTREVRRLPAFGFGQQLYPGRNYAFGLCRSPRTEYVCTVMPNYDTYTRHSGAAVRKVGTNLYCKLIAILTLTFPVRNLLYYARRYTIVVTNPSPADCRETAAGAIDVVPRAVVDDVNPIAVCEGAEHEIEISGNYFLNTEGAPPVVTLRHIAWTWAEENPGQNNRTFLGVTPPSSFTENGFRPARRSAEWDITDVTVRTLDCAPVDM